MRSGARYPDWMPGRRYKIALLIGCSLMLLRAGEGPTFRSDVTLVKVEAYVYDRNTRAPIHDLHAADFEVYDEQEPREILYFGNEDGPLDLVLLLDVSGSMRDVLLNVAGRAAEALSHLQAGDRTAVMAFGKRLAITQDITPDIRAIVQGIAKASDARVGLDTDINQAIWGAADYLRRRGGAAKRAVLIMTDNMQETRVPDRLVEEQLFEADAVLDGLLIRGRVAMPHIVHPGVLRFAQKTGGEVIEGSQPGTYLNEMIERIKSRYSIHFRPVGSKSDQPRRIRVQLTSGALRRYPNALVRARTSYFPHSTYRPKVGIPDGQRISERARECYASRHMASVAGADSRLTSGSMANSNTATSSRLTW